LGAIEPDTVPHRIRWVSPGWPDWQGCRSGEAETRFEPATRG
jgi:hypothetical protein